MTKLVLILKVFLIHLIIYFFLAYFFYRVYNPFLKYC